MKKSRVVSQLNYNLQSYKDRLRCVENLRIKGALDGAGVTELKKVANYLMYAEDVEAEVELKVQGKGQVSLESLLETPFGTNVVEDASTKNHGIYRNPKPTIDREKDKDIPHMQDLWVEVDRMQEKYDYCRAVLNDGQSRVEDEPCEPTYKNKYYFREQMIEFRREQYLLKDSYRPTLGAIQHIARYDKPRDEIGMRIGDYIIYETLNMIDYGNEKHIYELLKHYKKIDHHTKTIDDPMKEIYDFLKVLMDRVVWPNAYQKILDSRLSGLSIEETHQELLNYDGPSLSKNYISTVFKSHIPKRVVEEALIWVREKELKDNPESWITCEVCDEKKLIHKYHFPKKRTGEWVGTCIKCKK